MITAPKQKRFKGEEVDLQGRMARVLLLFPNRAAVIARAVKWMNPHERNIILNSIIGTEERQG